MLSSYFSALAGTGGGIVAFIHPLLSKIYDKKIVLLASLEVGGLKSGSGVELIVEMGHHVYFDVGRRLGFVS
jgi:hypothetical protein